jgi:mono/diheme cytochrome c family protein|tara:strand:+ start:3447 stop:3785 length:339 start_codon:yes stop_codon:yes gene_type:complete
LKHIALFFGALPLIILTQCAGSDTPTAQPTEDIAQPSFAAIKRIYTMKCSLCHGNDGKLMASKAPDLSKSKMSLEDRVAIISYGKGTMPPQKGILDAASIRGVAAYIEEFRD